MRPLGRKSLVVTGMVFVFVALFLSGCPRVAIVTVAGQPISDSLSLVVGATAALQARSISCDDIFSWSSSAPDVATVNTFGLVTAVAPGRAVITVTGLTSLASASVAVSVSPNMEGEGEGEGGNEVDWIFGESAPGGWSLVPSAPTTSDTMHFSGPTTVYSSTCVAIDSVGVPHLVMDPLRGTVELAFEPRPIMPCVMIYDPACGLAGTFGPLPEGDWVFFSHSAHDDLISCSIPFHVGPPALANRVPVSWINGETGPATWTEETLSLEMPLNGIRLAGPTQLFPSPCNGEAALGGLPFVSIDEAAHALTLVFQGPPPQVCTDIYAPVCGLQADLTGLVNGTWNFSAPTLTPPVQLTFAIGKALPRAVR